MQGPAVERLDTWTDKDHMGDRSYAHSQQFQYTWLYLSLPRLVPKQRGQASDIQRREHQPPKNIGKEIHARL